MLGRLARVREERIDPVKLAEWVELGPDNSPPWPANPDDASDPRRSEVHATAAPAMPVAPARGRAEELLENGIARALDTLERGGDAKPLLRGLLKLVNDARQLGLATIVLSVLIGGRGRAVAASTPPGFEPGLRGPSRRRRGFRVLPGAQRPITRRLARTDLRLA